MKWFTNLLVIVMLSMLWACSKSAPATTGNPPPPSPPPPMNTDTTAIQGTFTNGAHATSGKAIISMAGGTKKLLLENFKTDAGPDLYVYLATNKTASAFINLGLLKATTGNQQYDISGMPDFSKYNFVLIWCQQFGVLFGAAEIK